MFLSQSAHETTGCSHLLESVSSITCVMYAPISTSNPFLTQTNDCRSMEPWRFFFPLLFFFFSFFFFHSRDRDLAARMWRLLGQRAGESSARFTSGLLSIRHHLDRLLPFDSCLRPTETHWLEKVISLRPSVFEYPSSRPRLNKLGEREEILFQC